MKMFKRFAAALLAGVMVLAMLTACGGNGGGGAPVAHVTRDEALEKSVAEWTVEWGKSKNLELTVDDSLTAMSDKCLPAMVKIYDAQDQNASIAAQNELKNAFVAATNGKKVAPVDVFIPNTMEFTKENVMNVVQNGMGNIQTILTKAGVNNPTKFGVTVTKQKEYTLVLFVVSE